MTLITDWGSAAANCYVGLTEANSFITTAIIDSQAWTTASSIMQGAALLEATRDIDGCQYLGGPYFREQNLEFPRAIPAAFPFDYTEVSSMLYSVEQRKMKEDVEQATCHQALWLLKRACSGTIHAELRAEGVESWTDTSGPLSESWRYRPGMGKALCRESERLLSPWLTGRRVVRQ